nr:immunoglobulin heavy chain junction region [Mus musculus]MBK4188994.1 immunoglobulin heavy chain junction region [Mus musculus]MBK4188995.1 immunoglobulin heavy chain junction region [Mus musculus]MBK4188996.1 immunoglobulin heavy chain junction region [Mus musculus]
CARYSTLHYYAMDYW